MFSKRPGGRRDERPVRLLRGADHFPVERLSLGVQRIAVENMVPFHEHDFTELVIVTAGQGLHATSSEEVLIRRGDVFVIHDGERHEYREPDSLEVINLLFDSAILSASGPDLADIPGYHALFSIEPLLGRRGLVHHLNLDSNALTVAVELAEAIKSELAMKLPACRAMVTALLVQLAGHLARCYSRIKDPEPRALLRIGRVLSHMENHFTEPLPLGELADLAHMSPSTLLRAFRRAVGESPVAHLIGIRIRHACLLLTQSDMNVTEIAHDLGFSDSNYFARQFRRIQGMSPRRYRQARWMP